MFVFVLFCFVFVRISVQIFMFFSFSVIEILVTSHSRSILEQIIIYFDFVVIFLWSCGGIWMCALLLILCL